MTRLQMYTIHLSNYTPIVTKPFRQLAFQQLHNLAHPDFWTTKKLIQQRYVWCLTVLTDITTWTRVCISCLVMLNVQWHTRSTAQQFSVSNKHFTYAYLELVGLLPPSEGSTYLLICIDYFTRWPETISLSDIITDATGHICSESNISEPHHTTCPQMNLSRDGIAASTISKGS